MRKQQEKLIEHLHGMGFKEPPDKAIRRNPFSGRQHSLPPLAVMLYDFITTKTFICGKDYSRGQWDTARYMFLENWPDEYYDLID